MLPDQAAYACASRYAGRYGAGCRRAATGKRLREMPFSRFVDFA